MSLNILTEDWKKIIIEKIEDGETELIAEITDNDIANYGNYQIILVPSNDEKE